MTPRPTTSDAPGPSRWTWLCEPRGTLGLLLVWATLQALLRLGLSSALTADDAREAVLAQSLQWGYQARQPPLYNWLVWGAFRLIGPGLLALSLVKYSVLVLAFWLVYLTARRILMDRRLATLGTFSFLLIVPISWTIHEALSHSVAVLAASAGTAYALVRLDRAVTGRRPLEIARRDIVTPGLPVYLLGHPSGLPRKITGNASGTDNQSTTRFTTNLDSFGGNSGSPIFASPSNLLIGILVEGRTDYVPRGSCNVVNQLPDFPGYEGGTRSTAFAAKVP